MSRAIDFNPDDVRKVAQAVIDLEPDLVECRSDYRGCQFCGKTQGVSYKNGAEIPGGKFPHDVDCPVLIAQDLLTNQKGN